MSVLPIYSSDEYPGIVIFHFFSTATIGIWCFACRMMNTALSAYLDLLTFVD